MAVVVALWVGMGFYAFYYARVIIKCRPVVSLFAAIFGPVGQLAMYAVMSAYMRGHEDYIRYKHRNPDKVSLGDLSRVRMTPGRRLLFGCLTGVGLACSVGYMTWFAFLVLGRPFDLGPINYVLCLYGASGLALVGHDTVILYFGNGDGVTDERFILYRPYFEELFALFQFLVPLTPSR
jgi:hypothetical protein